MKRRYHGSRVSKTNRPKHFAGLLALALILVCTVGGTVAYLVTHTDPVVNTFTPGEVSCQVEEKFEGNNVKTEAVVKNTGNVPAYIRVAVVANTIDGEGNITGMETLPVGWLNAEKWTEVGGFYYYKGVVQPGNVTANLLTADGIDLTGIQVTILASAIQSMPDAAVEDAWNMSYNSGTSTWTEAVPSSN
ncbi:MAG: hypothetical protein PUC60_06865 [Clostridiales bacterium]|nr:hypothetical protein [Clostridiales bacterium]